MNDEFNNGRWDGLKDAAIAVMQAGLDGIISAKSAQECAVIIRRMLRDEQREARENAMRVDAIMDMRK